VKDLWARLWFAALERLTLRTWRKRTLNSYFAIKQEAWQLIMSRSSTHAGVRA
jgi:hypothetical protein